MEETAGVKVTYHREIELLYEYDSMSGEEVGWRC